MDELKFSSMKSTDIDQVFEIDLKAFPDPWTKNMLADCIGKFNCEVVGTDNKVYGYAIFSTVLDEAELLHIAVDPSQQHQGLGSKLMERILQLASDKGVKHWFLEVRESNRAAINLYQKYGFQMMGRRRSYYKNQDGRREDALTMHKGAVNC